MADTNHEHGKMDVTNQERMFASFVRWVTNAVIGIFVFLIFLLLVAG
ncbi:MAG: aa3-type cytochrome c oxidase subunit IV [Pseudomonadota bacterium]